jgi:hypothetical protein
MELFMEKTTIVGTNCYNCLYISKDETQVKPDELNSQGGLDPTNPSDMETAKKADLITLPGTKNGVNTKKFCQNDAVLMFVTSRMCCAYWDNEGAYRPWKRVSEPQYVDQML